MRLSMIVPLAAALLAPAATAQVAGPAAPGAPRPEVPTNGDSDGARGAPVNGVLVLYGNQRCPTNNDGQEVVVCVRRSAQEQFRIPKELREFQITPQNESWAVREQSTLAAGVGANSIGSCSTVGPGGQTGCLVQQANRARQEARARAEEATPDLDPY